MWHALASLVIALISQTHTLRFLRVSLFGKNWKTTTASSANFMSSAGLRNRWFLFSPMLPNKRGFKPGGVWSKKTSVAWLPSAPARNRAEMPNRRDIGTRKNQRFLCLDDLRLRRWHSVRCFFPKNRPSRRLQPSRPTIVNHKSTDQHRSSVYKTVLGTTGKEEENDNRLSRVVRGKILIIIIIFSLETELTIQSSFIY